MALLLLVYILSFVDRQIISILAQSIKKDLVLSNIAGRMAYEEL
jgi:hypothetical protein